MLLSIIPAKGWKRRGPFMSELKCDPISPGENRVVVRGDLSRFRKGLVGSQRGKKGAVGSTALLTRTIERIESPGTLPISPSP